MSPQTTRSESNADDALMIVALARVIDQDTPIPSMPKPRPVADTAPTPVRIGGTALSAR